MPLLRTARAGGNHGVAERACASRAFSLSPPLAETPPPASLSPGCLASTSGGILARTRQCARPSSTTGALCSASHPPPKACPMAPHPAQRRPQASAPSLADAQVADRWRHLVGAHSGLATGRNRSEAPQAPWAQARPQTPQSPPTHTPDHVARAVVSLRLTLRHHGTGGGATALLPARAPPGSAPVPSRRTRDRLGRRHHTEGQERGARASMADDL
jgi:hypothetical protein